MEPQSAPVFSNLVTGDQPIYLRPSRGEAVKVALAGLLVGLLMPLLGYWLNHFFLRPVFCSSGDPLGLCTGSADTAYYAATVICALALVIVMVNWQVFRPLPIVVAVVIALWGMQHYFPSDQLSFYVLSGLFYALATLLFYWLLRVHQFAVGLILLLVAVVLIRLAWLI